MKKLILFLFMLPVLVTAQNIIADSVISYGGGSFDGRVDVATAVTDDNAVPLGQLVDSLNAKTTNWLRVGGHIYPKIITDSVGIGTYTPDFLFDVNGNSQFSGRIAINGTGKSIFIGNTAGRVDDLTDNANVFIGEETGYNTTTGSNNIAIGQDALRANISGSTNIAIGDQTLSANTGGENTAIGHSAMAANTTGGSNVALGRQALGTNTNGIGNTAIGYKAGNNTTAAASNTSPDDCVYIGYDTRAKSATSTNEIVIGTKANGGGSNTVVIGDDNITTIYMSEDLSAETRTGELTTNNSFGELYDPSNTISTTSFKYFTVSGWTEGQTNEADINGDSAIIINQGGIYKVSYSFSFSHSGSTVATEICIFNSTDNSEHTNMEASTLAKTANDYYNLSGTGLVAIDQDHRISVRAKADKTGTLTFLHGNLNFIRIK